MRNYKLCEPSCTIEIIDTLLENAGPQLKDSLRHKFVGLVSKQSGMETMDEVTTELMNQEGGRQLSKKEWEKGISLLRKVISSAQHCILQCASFSQDETKVLLKYFDTADRRELTSNKEIFSKLSTSHVIFLAFGLECDCPPSQDKPFLTFNPQEGAIQMIFKQYSEKIWYAVLPVSEEDFRGNFFTETLSEDGKKPKIELKLKCFQNIFHRFIKNFFPEDKQPKLLDSSAIQFDHPLFSQAEYRDMRKELRIREFTRFMESIKRAQAYYRAQEMVLSKKVQIAVKPPTGNDNGRMVDDVAWC